MLNNIMNAFSLKSKECKITKVGTNGYKIAPKNENEKLHIYEANNAVIADKKYHLSFEKCVFEYDVFLGGAQNIEFKECIFKKNIKSRCNKDFEKKICFHQTIFEGNVYFMSIFKDEVTFSESQFNKEAIFSKSIFKKSISFEKSIFNGNAHFAESKFEGGANFNLSEFCKNAHFYEASFKEMPNFFQAIFNGNINFTDTKLDFIYEDVKNKIKQTREKRARRYKKEENELKLYKITNEFRDSFRNIKSALIEHHSMLDASNYHRVELYCKELELEYKREEKAKTFCEKFKFILSNGKDFVDEIQLYCYRLTSDHHTNLLMILNNVIFLIALFGLANLMLIPFDETYTISFFKINVIETIVCLIFMSTAICFIFGSWKIFMLKPIYLLLLFLFLALVFSFSPILVLVVLSIYSAILLSAVLLLLLFSYFLIKIQKILDLKQCIFILSYLIAAFMLFSSPSSILPILGKLIENKSGEMCLFVIGNIKLLCCGGASSTPETLNLIYMLFLFLLLWSLQKTARKNTIVPS
ncbi:MAG: hypothetical protein HDT12_00720 [Helicobacter sp.]|nr:hypothetical protein [Helicobacter sp.]